jgi:hypothetical protein
MVKDQKPTLSPTKQDLEHGFSLRAIVPNYTQIDEIFVCNDCGAYGESAEAVQHFPDCTPGESEKWREFYNQPDPEDLPVDEQTRMAYGESDLGTRFTIIGGEVYEF